MIPVRTCLACGQRMPKQAMLRIVWQQGRLVADHKGRLPGRGGYFCGTENCAHRLRHGKLRAKPPGGMRDARQWRELIADIEN